MPCHSCVRSACGSARIVCGLMGVALVACSVGTAYRKPEIALSPAWNALPTQVLAAQGAGGPSAASAWPAADWWRGFGSARLDELIEQARESNDDLAGAIARVREADAQLRIAGAPLLPAVDLGATATRERASVPGQGITLSNAFSPELTASYEIDFWGKNRAVRDAARAAAAASRYAAGEQAAPARSSADRRSSCDGRNRARSRKFRARGR